VLLIVLFVMQAAEGGGGMSGRPDSAVEKVVQVSARQESKLFRRANIMMLQVWLISRREPPQAYTQQ
jgi:hypothetical protein